jgi:hypothetical protein
MFQKNRAFQRLTEHLGQDGTDFLDYALAGITRILPHTEVCRWNVANHQQSKTGAAWGSAARRQLKLTIGLAVGNTGDTDYFTLSATLQRKTAPTGVGHVQRTIDKRERDICERIIERIPRVLNRPTEERNRESLLAIRTLFDEQIVASHVQHHHDLKLDLSNIFTALRNVAEQSYENKSLTFGCLLDPGQTSQPSKNGKFPEDVLAWKRYKALSDGYRTAYRVSTHGRTVRFEDLMDDSGLSIGTHIYPEWCEFLAKASQNTVCGVCLTRQGDILVFDADTLRFTYRYGRWQYWNHTHIIDLLKSRARAQRVRPQIITKVVKAIYRAALDVSFRRCGGLFVLLHNRNSLREMALLGDAIDDGKRESIHTDFDKALPSCQIQTLSRRLLVGLASLDGAVVLNNHGQIMAYGAVLNPRRKGKIGPAEGSRTKAAIGASKYGISVKVSSDGDITFYENGKSFFSA